MGLDDPAAIIGKTDILLGTPEPDEDFIAAHEVIVSGKPQLGVVKQEASPDGAIQWSLISRIPLTAIDGSVAGMLGISRDITGLKVAEELAQRRASQLLTSAEIARDTSGTLDLDAMLSKARDAKNTQEENMRSLLKAYFKFGTVYSEYYDIMFNLRTPKVADYIGTELEEIAVTKLQKIGRRTFGYFFNLVNEVYESRKKVPSGDEIQYRTVQLWANIHGVVTLYNSRQIAELVKSPKRFIDARIEAEIRELLGNAK